MENKKPEKSSIYELLASAFLRREQSDMLDPFSPNVFHNKGMSTPNNLGPQASAPAVGSHYTNFEETPQIESLGSCRKLGDGLNSLMGDFQLLVAKSLPSTKSIVTSA